MNDSAAPRPVRILMADDDPADCLLTAKTLQKARLDNELRFVQDGQELLDYLEHRGKFADPESAPRPDLILLDLAMPNKDGLGSLWEMNLKPMLRRIPVLILTGSDAALDMSESYNLGAYAYLVKPVSFSKLHEAVQRLKGFRYELSVPASSDGPRRAASILMADADPEDCLSAAKALQAAGLLNPLAYVTDGEALMDHLEGRREYGEGVPAERPDLLMLDPAMPRQDGREALAAIDDHPALRDLPVILHSSATGGGARQGEGAARAFLPKPMAFEAFAGAVAALESLALTLVTVPARDGAA